MLRYLAVKFRLTLIQCEGKKALIQEHENMAITQRLVKFITGGG